MCVVCCLLCVVWCCCALSGVRCWLMVVGCLRVCGLFDVCCCCCKMVVVGCVCSLIVVC